MTGCYCSVLPTYCVIATPRTCATRYPAPLLQARHKILSPSETAAALAVVAPAEQVPTALRGGGKCSAMPLEVARTLGFAQMDAKSFESLLIRQPESRGGCAGVYSIPRLG